MTLIEPLKFERHFVEKIWGGRSLEAALRIALPAGRTIGETWEIVDRAAENSRVAAGEWAGRTLGELMSLHGRELLGRAPAGKGGRFPLLVKYIDPAENLSVQVHPGDASHGRFPGAEAKTEAWYIVAAQPGSKLYVGLRPEVTREHFARVAAGPGVVDTLLAWDVRAGDCVLVPGGTVHAISAGVTILEVQQNSDTTYRLWDWGRAGRETHVQQALEVVHFGAATPGPLRGAWAANAGLERAQLARSPHFAMDALRLSGRALCTTDEQVQIYAVLDGGGTLRWRERSYTLARGDVWLIPACVGEHTLDPDGAMLVVNLRCLG